MNVASQIVTDSATGTSKVQHATFQIQILQGSTNTMSKSDSDPSKKDEEKKKSSDSDEDKFVRRSFFLEGFRSLIKPVADAVEKKMDRVEKSMESAWESGESDYDYSTEGYSYGEEEDRLLRPPGALTEELFLDRCSRGAQCVASCPVQAIQLLDTDDPEKAGTPYIDPHIQACVVCEDLSCMQNCPSGALQQVPANLISMGIAELRRDHCLRSDGEDCQICVEKCPLGQDAIEIPYQGADVEVKTDGCIGCGVCEMYCPTEPRAIVILEKNS